MSKTFTFVLWIVSLTNLLGQDDDFRLRKIMVFRNNYALCEISGEVKADKGMYRFIMPNNLTIADVLIEGDINYIRSIQVKDSLKIPTQYTTYADILKANIGKYVNISSSGVNYKGTIVAVTNDKLLITCPELKAIAIETIYSIYSEVTEIGFKNKASTQQLKLTYVTDKIRYNIFYGMEFGANNEVKITPYFEFICENQQKADNVQIAFTHYTYPSTGYNFATQNDQYDFVLNPALGVMRNKKHVSHDQKMVWFAKEMNISGGITQWKQDEIILPADTFIVIGNSNPFRNKVNLVDRGKINDSENHSLTLTGNPGTVSRWESDYNISIRNSNPTYRWQGSLSRLTNNFSPDTLVVHPFPSYAFRNTKKELLPSGKIGLFKKQSSELYGLGFGILENGLLPDSSIVLGLPQKSENLNVTRYQKQIWKKEFVKVENGNYFDSIYVECKYVITNKQNVGINSIFNDELESGSKIYYVSVPDTRNNNPIYNRNPKATNEVFRELTFTPNETKNIIYRYRYLAERVR